MTDNIKITSWNVNSVRARIEHVKIFIEQEDPDIFLLQELKCADEAFPHEAFEDYQYNIAINGLKGYSGVGILSKYPLENVERSFPGDPQPGQARYISADIFPQSNNAVHIASLYAPNGTEIDSDRFRYKLDFYDNLIEHAKSKLSPGAKVVIGGDYNISPEAMDVYDSNKLDGMLCFHPQERKRLRRMLNAGYIDAFRCLYPNKADFTWWDYRQGAVDKDLGMRIDHMLLSGSAMQDMQDTVIHKKYRLLSRPSDHAPVSCILSLGN